MKKLGICTALVLALLATYAVAQAGAAGQAQGQSVARQQGDYGEGVGQDQDKDRDRDEAKDKDGDKNNDLDKRARVDDRQLLHRVRDQLSSRPDFRNIEVSVANGVVDLNGSVAKKEDRAEAVDLAKSVQGVRRVRQHLKIDANAGSEPASASKHGEEAGEKREEMGQQRPAASSEAAEQSGQNTAGSVAGNTTAEAGAAAGAAQQGTNSGVTAESGATGQTAGANAQVQSQIQQAIQNDSALASSNVRVNVMNNEVLLSGSVATDQEKQQAERIAQQHANGLQVVNDINVGAAAAAASSASSGGISGAVTGAPQPSNQQAGAAGAVGSPTQETVPRENTSESGGMAPDQLKSQLDQALQKEPTLSSCNLMSHVSPDSIELSGSCPTGKEKQTARRMAQSLAGNRRVVDLITVTGRGQGANQDKQNQNQVPPQF